MPTRKMITDVFWRVGNCMKSNHPTFHHPEEMNMVKHSLLSEIKNVTLNIPNAMVRDIQIEHIEQKTVDAVAKIFSLLHKKMPELIGNVERECKDVRIIQLIHEIEGMRKRVEKEMFRWLKRDGGNDTHAMMKIIFTFQTLPESDKQELTEGIERYGKTLKLKYRSIESIKVEWERKEETEGQRTYTVVDMYSLLETALQMANLPEGAWSNPICPLKQRIMELKESMNQHEPIKRFE